MSGHLSNTAGSGWEYRQGVVNGEKGEFVVCFNGNTSIFCEIGRCCQASFEGLEICWQKSVDAARRRRMSDPLSSPEWKVSGRESLRERVKAGKSRYYRCDRYDDD